MPENPASPSPSSVSGPNVFSRGSLKLTFDLIRRDNAQLALVVRNILGGKALPKNADQVDNENSDHFLVALDSFQVRSIVECLMKQIQADSTGGDSQSGAVILAKALVDDWIVLAHKMVAELPDDQKP